MDSIDVSMVFSDMLRQAVLNFSGKSYSVQHVFLSLHITNILIYNSRPVNSSISKIDTSQTY